MFAEGVNALLETYSDSVATHFITISDAMELVHQDLGITVTHATLAHWVAIHGLGHKLEGIKGQWIVDAELFNQFLIEKPVNRKSKLWGCI